MLAWTPIAITGDVLLGTLFAALTAGAARLPRARGVAVALVLLAAVGAVILEAGNVLKYAIDHSPITLADLLGAQGGTLADLNLVEPRGLLPVVAALVVQLALAPLALVARRRLVRTRAIDVHGRRLLAVLVAVPALVAGADRLWWADDNLLRGNRCRARTPRRRGRGS